MSRVTGLPPNSGNVKNSLNESLLFQWLQIDLVQLEFVKERVSGLEGEETLF